MSPVYNYCCSACGHKFEAQTYVVARRLVSCPKCQHFPSNLRPSAPAFAVKGFNAKNGYAHKDGE